MFSNAKISLLALVFFLSSCATLSMLPKSASEVNFSKKIQGKTGWSKYEGIKFFKGIDEKTCHLAAKAGLTYANFQIKKESFEKRLVLGEHGTTAYDWNIIAGAYIKPENNGCLAKLIVEGSKDLGGLGQDRTARNWTQDIFLGMREYLISNNKIFKVEKEIQKPSYLAEESGQQQAQAKKEPSPQSGTGSGFFVSKMGHVITNAHVVQNCKKVTIGDNANKQVPAELINTDRSNDLALLKLSTLEMASAESKSLIQKLNIVVVPLASKGLLRSEDVRLGEKVLVAGYPFGELFSNTIKVTSGIVSATRGAGDDSGQFQLDAAVQPGNSGGPIYDSGGNIVGVVISQLDKLKMAQAIGSLPENVNFGIKASTVRQFLTSSGLPSKKSERTEEKSTEQLAEIAKNQALMVMCLQ
jgi:S1-C subfamily serine protease